MVLRAEVCLVCCAPRRHLILPAARKRGLDHGQHPKGVLSGQNQGDDSRMHQPAHRTGCPVHESHRGRGWMDRGPSSWGSHVRPRLWRPSMDHHQHQQQQHHHHHPLWPQDQHAREILKGETSLQAPTVAPRHNHQTGRSLKFVLPRVARSSCPPCPRTVLKPTPAKG